MCLGLGIKHDRYRAEFVVQTPDAAAQFPGIAMRCQWFPQHLLSRLQRTVGVDMKHLVCVCLGLARSIGFDGVECSAIHFLFPPASEHNMSQHDIMSQ